MLVIILTMAFYTIQIYGRFLQPPFNNNNKTPLTILEQFLDYEVIIHFDNASMKNWDTLFTTQRHHRQAIYLVNYDMNNKITTRPKGYKYMNIVFLQNPFEFESYSKVDYNFLQYDFVLMILEEYTEQIQAARIWMLSGLDRAASILIYDILNNRMLHCCYYCDKATAVLQEVASFGLRHQLNNYTDFKGHTFNIAYANFPPFFWCEYHKSICVPKGAEGELLHEVSKVHNFRYNLIEYRTQIGIKGAWQAMVEAVQFRQVDWAVGGLSVSLKRGTYTDFTRYIKTQGFAILYATYDRTWMAFENLFLVFEWTVWFCIGSTIIFICFIAKVASSHLDNSGKTYLDYVKLAMMSIIEQTAVGHIKSSSLSSVRMIFLIWWLNSLCLTSLYKSQLASVLIKPNSKEPNTIEQLIEAGFGFHVNSEDWGVLRENLISSSDAVYTEILTRIDKMDFCRSVIDAVGRKVAVIDEEIPIQFDIYKKCNNVIEPNQQSKLRLITENLFPNSYHGWSMQLATPFRLRFSKTIGRMDDYGLIDHWYRAASFYRLPRSNQRIKRRNSLTIIQILPSFFILAFGLFTALCVFLIEIYN